MTYPGNQTLALWFIAPGKQLEPCDPPPVLRVGRRIGEKKWGKVKRTGWEEEVGEDSSDGSCVAVGGKLKAIALDTHWIFRM